MSNVVSLVHAVSIVLDPRSHRPAEAIGQIVSSPWKVSSSLRCPDLGHGLAGEVARQISDALDQSGVSINVIDQSEDRINVIDQSEDNITKFD